MSRNPSSWVISRFVSNGSVVYWSDDLGWTSVEEADKYTSAEKDLVDKPDDGTWVELRDE